MCFGPQLDKYRPDNQVMLYFCHPRHVATQIILAFIFPHAGLWERFKVMCVYQSVR